MLNSQCSVVFFMCFLFRVQKGWRLVAINGLDLSDDGEASKHYASAHKRGQHTVTFIDPLSRENRLKEMASERAKKASEKKVRALAELAERGAQELARKREELAREKEEAGLVKIQQQKDAKTKADQDTRAKVAAAKAAKAARAGLASVLVAVKRAQRDSEALSRQREKRTSEARKQIDTAAKAKMIAAIAAHAAQSANTDCQKAIANAESKIKNTLIVSSIPAPGKAPEAKIVTTGALTELLPKKKVENPQQALMQALTAAPAPRRPALNRTGPCDKCDGSHHSDDCPYFKKDRDKHKDAWAGYAKDGGNTSTGGGGTVAESPATRSGRVVKQPGDGSVHVLIPMPGGDRVWLYSVVEIASDWGSGMLVLNGVFRRSCLFHSLSYGMGMPGGGGGGGNGGGAGGATALRRDIAAYVRSHPDALMAGTPIRDWVLWDSGLSPRDYAARMGTGRHWGGAIEIAVCVLVTRVPVHVYEAVPSASGGKFKRISAFEPDPAGGESGEGKPAPKTGGSGSGRGNGSGSGKAITVVYSGRVHYDAIVLGEQ